MRTPHTTAAAARDALRRAADQFEERLADADELVFPRDFVLDLVRFLRNTAGNCDWIADETKEAHDDAVEFDRSFEEWKAANPEKAAKFQRMMEAE